MSMPPSSSREPAVPASDATEMSASEATKPIPAATPEDKPKKSRWRRWQRKVKRGILRFLTALIVPLILMVMTVMVFWSSIVITIMPGEAGVHYQRFLGGTVTDHVYGEGIHLIFPWDLIYIYDVRVNTVHHSFDVLTNRGLPIHLDLAIRYQPEYEMVGVLHQRVGPDYLNKIVLPQSESVLRRNIGQHNPEDIYTNKEGILSAIISHALEEMSQKYLNVDDIIIRKMTLPPMVKSAVEEKLVYEQQAKAYDFLLQKEQREAERKKIEAMGIREYQRVIAETLNDKLLAWQGINATLALSESNNSKVVVIGSGENGLPIILGGDYTSSHTSSHNNAGAVTPKSAEKLDTLMQAPPPKDPETPAANTNNNRATAQP